MKQIHDAVEKIAGFLRNRGAWRLLLLGIVLFQMAVIACWAGQRSNYYIDELFSFGSAHSFTFEKKDVYYVNNSPEFRYETWVENRVLKEQLVVTEAESLLRLNPLNAVRRVLLGRNYHGILNLLMAVFSPGRISAIPALVFNLLLFSLAQLVLFGIMREMTDSYSVSALAILMYGCSGMAVMTVLYVRFYMLVTLLLLLILRIHQVMWRDRSLIRCESLTILGMVLLYLAFKDSELVFVIGGALVGVYALGLLLGKQWKKAALYILTIFPVSLIYALMKTSLIDMALNPAKYAGGDGAEGWMMEKLLTVNKGRVIALIGKYLEWVSSLLFGSWYVLCSFLILILLLLEFRFLGKKKTSPAVKSGNGPRAGHRVPCPESFIWIVAAVCLIYYVFSLLVSIPAERYFMFYFPLLVILLWVFIHRLMKGIKYRKEIILAFALLTCAGITALWTVRPDRIDFIYREDRPLVEALRESGMKDVIVINTGELDSSHSIYDCIYLMPADARLYPVKKSACHIDAAECPDEMLVWIHADRIAGQYIEDLTAAGYELAELGRTHASDVYTARR